MKSVVVYESLWGNTAAVAKAVAEGLGEGAVALSTAEADAAALEGADLIVAGAPLLGFSLPTEQMRSNIAANPGPGAPKPDTSAPSMRAWIEALPRGATRVAGFETRIWWSPGSAAKSIASALSAKGYTVAAPAEKFVVTGKFGPLKEGELERARRWGVALARSVAP
jgi:flavorubredoxin